MGPGRMTASSIGARPRHNHPPPATLEKITTARNREVLLLDQGDEITGNRFGGLIEAPFLALFLGLEPLVECLGADVIAHRLPQSIEFP